MSSDESMSKWLLKVKNVTSSNIFSLKCEFIFIPSQKHLLLQSYLGGFFNLPLPLFIKKYLCWVPFPMLFTTRTEMALEKLI